MQKIVTLTTEGESREDGNVYYSTSVLVESDTLKFDEPVFASMVSSATYADYSSIITEIRSLGYTVHQFEEKIITIGE